MKYGIVGTLAGDVVTPDAGGTLIPLGAARTDRLTLRVAPSMTVVHFRQEIGASLAAALGAVAIDDPATLTGPQFRSFLREAGLTVLYDAAVASLAASSSLQDRFVADVLTGGTQFYWPQTLALGMAAAAAATPPVTLDPVALRAVWDTAAGLEIVG